MTIHNVLTFYESDDGDEAMVSFSRPQDWGNPKQWQYLTASIWVPNDDRKFRCRNCHIWCHPRHDRWEFLREIGGMLFTFTYPGQPVELCDRSHLSVDDFWLSDWGEMPPYWDDEDCDPWDRPHPEMDLIEVLNDLSLIPIALTPEYATIVASLMQLSLRHPRVRSQTPHLYEKARPFVETLVDSIIERYPEHGDTIRRAFEDGWDESKDLTSAEFNVKWGKFVTNPESNN